MIRTLFFLALLGLSSLSGPVQANEAPQSDPRLIRAKSDQLTIGRWADLAPNERQLTVLAAIESLFLASLSEDDSVRILDESCLAQKTPLDVENELLEVSERYAEQSFVDVFLAVTKCYDDGGAL